MTFGIMWHQTIIYRLMWVQINKVTKCNEMDNIDGNLIEKFNIMFDDKNKEQIINPKQIIIKHISKSWMIWWDMVTRRRWDSSLEDVEYY